MVAARSSYFKLLRLLGFIASITMIKPIGGHK